LALADLARHLIETIERGETRTLPSVFEVVERWMADGDPIVREAAVIGPLEVLQNANLHTTTEPEQFRRFLGPKSIRWWEKLRGFWDRGELLTEQ
jgi:hypothetical protein